MSNTGQSAGTIGRETAMIPKRQGFWSMVNKDVFIPPAILLLIGVFFGIVFPEGFGKCTSAAFNFCLTYFSWFYAIGVVMLFVFSLWAGFSKYGAIKLGGPEAEPEMSYATWFCIALTSGIAIGIVFYAVGEPMAHYMNPAPFLGIEPNSIASAEHALKYTFLHWALHPYAIYTSAGVCIAFMYYNCGRSFKVSSSLYPLFGDKVNGALGSFVDGLSIFAIVAGIGTALGLGTMQIGSGMEYVWGIKSTPTLWLIIISTLAVIYTISSCTGLHKGITIISNLNVYIYCFLLIWVLVFGPTVPILNNTVSAIGEYLGGLIPASFFLDPMAKSGWPSNWTMFYWAWWLAGAPIIGLFLVRLAKGRTIKQFVLVNMIAPSIFAILWFGIFGTASIYMDHFMGAGIGEIITKYGIPVSFYALLQQLPLSGVIIIVAFLAIMFSFITLAESMTLTLASMTTKNFGDAEGDIDAPAFMKVFWGGLIGLIAFALLLSGGIKALQTSAVVAGLPILVLQLFMAASYIKAMIGRKDYDTIHKSYIK